MCYIKSSHTKQYIHYPNLCSMVFFFYCSLLYFLIVELYKCVKNINNFCIFASPRKSSTLFFILYCIKSRKKFINIFFPKLKFCVESLFIVMLHGFEMLGISNYVLFCPRIEMEFEERLFVFQAQQTQTFSTYPVPAA